MSSSLMIFLLLKSRIEQEKNEVCGSINLSDLKP